MIQNTKGTQTKSIQHTVCPTLSRAKQRQLLPTQTERIALASLRTMRLDRAGASKKDLHIYQTRTRTHTHICLYIYIFKRPHLYFKRLNIHIYLRPHLYFKRLFKYTRDYRNGVVINAKRKCRVIRDVLNSVLLLHFLLLFRLSLHFPNNSNTKLILTH